MNIMEFIDDKEYVKLFQVQIEKDNYHIHLHLTPVNEIKEKFELKVSKKFESISALHKKLSKYHQKLHRPNAMPSLVKIQLFDRNPDIATLIERKKSVETFLHFCVENRHLYTHAEFVGFCKDFKKVEPFPPPLGEEQAAVHLRPSTLSVDLTATTNANASVFRDSVDGSTVIAEANNSPLPTVVGTHNNKASPTNRYLEEAHTYSQAAASMSSANDLDGAQHLYELAVGVLLKGVKQETDAQLRQLAHQLASEYLQKAEMINQKRTNLNPNQGNEEQTS